MTTAEKLKHARAFRNITQQALSDMTGISVRLIQKYESGDRSPKDDNLEKIATALNVSSKALSEPSLTTYDDILFTFFELEKDFGEITLETRGNMITICIDNNRLNDLFKQWQKAKEECSRDELEEWQLSYPRKNVKTLKKGELVSLDE